MAAAEDDKKTAEETASNEDAAASDEEASSEDALLLSSCNNVSMRVTRMIVALPSTVGRTGPKTRTASPSYSSSNSVSLSKRRNLPSPKDMRCVPSM